VTGISEKTLIIPNGYDPSDFAGLERTEPEVFTISYIGTLSDAYPVSGFAAAVRSLVRSGLRIRLRFTGAVSPASKEILRSATGTIDPEFSSHVSHREAVRQMVQSSALLLVIPDHRSNRSILTGKLFEYLASGRPVICIGPLDGDAANILARTSHGKCAGYNDTEEIARIIREIYETSPQPDLEAPPEFSRLELAGKLASLLG
jgi:glycosyltransferase involved in cell wall biosynthesis